MSEFMGEAIALSSPSGHMSKRARKAALKRLHDNLFPNGIQLAMPAPYTTREKDLMQAKRLRELAARGMSTRKFNREADRLEALYKEGVR
jgi:hypothetical protein